MTLSIIHIFAVALGGAIGASLRYYLSSLFGSHGILVINILGCFALGMLVSLFALKISVSQTTNLFLTVGILGGFTTFSAFGYETFAMLREAEYLRAILNAGVQVLLGLALVWLGYNLATSR